MSGPAAPALDPLRRVHYAHFYGEPDRSDRPGPAPDGSVVVVGNCQAESLRLLLDPHGRRSVRIPPVFELEPDDVGRLHALLARATTLVVQPIHAGYRGMALGTDQLAAHLPAGGRTVVVPSVRHNALHPAHVVQHPPPGTDPLPVVPYHDLRVVHAALHGGDPVRPVREDGVREVAAASLAELVRREAGTTVAVSDVLRDPHPDQMRTVNHPGNPVLLALAGRAAAAAGLPAPVDPGRPLLASVRAPVEAAVAATWGFARAPEHDHWWLDGVPVVAAEVTEAHLEWYAAHPAETRAVWARHERQAGRLGLAR
ncbi:peptide ABC transporter ATPase [Nocardioides anomalus]|uniref:Peptide ABC transporter ATPase n=1 Tax=Nocardioides anomalus TaxID=2712223 RepID=A0A6G6WDK7_9ACTN|nr:WcbI family polysaccharide biosynthesis putative acetyltransferase [Nocardioides anomalus]QIG43314.1 peptide ABC transporter ATPase [Nocardioides anomalus]